MSNNGEQELNEMRELYGKVSPFIKRKLSFDEFLFFIEIIGSITCEDDAMELTEFFKGNSAG